MTVEQRIKICLLIEKMNRQKSYSKKLGLENVSKFMMKESERKEMNYVPD